jgi:hypothetical protein
MATIDAITGKIVQPTGDVSGSTPDQQTTFMNNITQMLSDAQQSAQPSRDALLAQKSGLEVGQAGLGAVSANNPLAFLYNMAPNDAKASMYTNTSNMFNPGIASIANQITAGDQRVQNVANVISGMKDTLAAQAAIKNAGVGRYSTGVFPGTTQLYSYDSVTGLYTDQYGNPVTPPNGHENPSPDPLVNGIDYSSYNGRMDPDYTKKMQNATSTLQNAMPNGFDPTIADNLLKTYKSPLNSNMISLAAQQYGISPIDLMANVSHESVYGTSPVAREDNNLGGIKFAGQPGAVMGTLSPEGDHYAKFDNLQDALYAQAKLLAQYTPGNKLYTPPPTGKNPTQPTPANDVTQTGVSFTALKKSAPPAVSGALLQTQSNGGVFIDLSKIPGDSGDVQYSAMVRNYAAQNHIPLLSADQSQAALQTDEAIRNIVNVIAPAWEKIAPRGIVDQFTNKETKVFSHIGDTDFYANNKTFKDNQENVAQQIKALSDSAPKLGLLSVAENALPDNSGYFGVNPFSGDLYKDGVTKMNRTLQLLNQNLQTLIPGSKPVSLPGGAGGSTSSGVTSGGIKYTIH